MSSILKALKRLEADAAADPPAADARDASWLAQGEVTPTWSDRLWEAGVAHGRLWRVVLPAIAAVALAAWMLLPRLGNRGESIPTAGLSAPNSGRPDRSAAPEADDPRLAPVQTPPPGTGPGTLSPGDRSQPAAPRPPAAQPSEKPVLFTPRKTVVKAGLETTRPLPQRKTPKIATAADPNTPTPGDNAGIPPGKPSVEGLPADTGLRLQAVSWSPDSSRRIAVINDRILHIGETVDGFTVQGIDPDTVILRRFETDFRLAFLPR